MVYYFKSSIIIKIVVANFKIMVFGLKKKNCKIKFKLVLNIKIILFKYIFLIYFLEKKNNEKISHVISYNM